MSIEIPISILDHDEVIRSLSPFVEIQLNARNPLEVSWNPTQPKTGIWLPDPRSDSFFQDSQQLAIRADRLHPGVLAVWGGNMITEGDLPGYAAWWMRIPSVKDPSGRSTEPWHRWLRRWWAEEWVHGTVGRDYAIQSRTFNMSKFDSVTQYLISNGFDPDINPEDPYEAMIYVSFQELATETAHGNVGLLVKEVEPVMANISEHIRIDERSHALFYRKVMRRVFEQDPDGATISFWKMMRKGIEMPAALMTERDQDLTGLKESQLYKDYSLVTQALGIYTAEHYVKILEFLMNDWKVLHNRLTQPEALKAQLSLDRFRNILLRKLDQATNIKLQGHPEVDIPWLNSNRVPVTGISSEHRVDRDFWFYDDPRKVD